MATRLQVDAVTWRPVPVLVTLLLGLGIPIVAGILAALLSRLIPIPPPKIVLLPWLYLQHAFQLLLSLVAIMLIKRHVPADYGLHLPRGRSYAGPALLLGAVFGIIMLLVDFAPNIMSGHPPALGYKLTPQHVAGWLLFAGIYVGPTEETLFRGLLVTYLATVMPGRVRWGRWDVSVGGIVVAVVFALAHVTSFWTEPLEAAIGQQIYAIALGILYAYFLEKSRSLLAPMLAHNASDFVETALQMLWVGLSH
jgi:membrane protease YdiL (CAAX protease family)